MNPDTQTETHTQSPLMPLGDQVLVRPVEEDDVTPGGIVLPDAAKGQPVCGRVLAVGRGRYSSGKLIEMEVAEGDTVYYSVFSGSELEVDGTTIRVLREAEIFALRR